MRNANGGEPNLYAHVDMIPEKGMNGSIHRLKRHCKWSSTTQIMSETVQND